MDDRYHVWRNRETTSAGPTKQRELGWYFGDRIPCFTIVMVLLSSVSYKLSIDNEEDRWPSSDDEGEMAHGAGKGEFDWGNLLPLNKLIDGDY